MLSTGMFARKTVKSGATALKIIRNSPNVMSRATYMVSSHLRKANPPILSSKWTPSQMTYTMARCGMSSDAPSNTDKIFEGIKPLIGDDLKKEMSGVLAFVVGGQSWLIDAHPDRPLRVVKEATDAADVTMTTDDATFEKMAKGETKATNAFMSGKLKIKGNIAVAMRAEKLFAKLKGNV